jgi:hypothetical protein
VRDVVRGADPADGHRVDDLLGPLGVVRLGEQPGRDRARPDRVDRDPEGAELEGPHPRARPDQACLGCRIGAAERLAQRGPGGHVHDATEACVAHAGQQCLRALDRGAKVEREGGVELPE